MFEKEIKALIHAANGLVEPGNSEEFRAAAYAAKEAGLIDDPAALLVLANAVPEVTAAPGAGLLAVWLGARVEAGHAPEPLIPPLLRAFRGWASRIKLAGDGAANEPVDEALGFGLDQLGRAVVACIARSSASLVESLRCDPALIGEITRISDVSVGAIWLETLLRQESGRVLVYHVGTGKGALLDYRNIANCFHLFTLLQHELSGVIPGAKKASPQLWATACGETADQVKDSALWHYGRGDVPEADFVGSIWGEGAPSEIPQIAGLRVILLWPKILACRGWDSGFFHPRLDAAPAEVRFVGSLTDTESDQWRERLGLPRPTPRRWWTWKAWLRSF